MAHTRLLSPTPRTNDDALKDTNGGAPCGGKPRTGTPAVYTMGQQVTVRWEETINHPGCFIIKLSPANDTSFTMLANPPHSTTGAVPRQYMTTLTLPAGMTCDACTLQLIQVMDAAATCPITNIPTGEAYYSCADVRILAPGGTGGGAGGGGAAGGSAGGAAGGTTTGAGGGGGEVGGSGGTSHVNMPVIGSTGGAGSDEGELGGVAEGGCSTAGAPFSVALLAMLRLIRRRPEY